MKLSDFLLSEPASKKTSSGIVRTGKCIFHGFLIGTDGVNDPTITVFDNTAASGQEIIPSATYDASQLGLNGVTGINMYCANGIYVEITCAGACEVVIQYTPYPGTSDYNRW